MGRAAAGGLGGIALWAGGNGGSVDKPLIGLLTLLSVRCDRNSRNDVLTDGSIRESEMFKIQSCATRPRLPSQKGRVSANLRPSLHRFASIVHRNPSKCRRLMRTVFDRLERRLTSYLWNESTQKCRYGTRARWTALSDLVHPQPTVRTAEGTLRLRQHGNKSVPLPPLLLEDERHESSKLSASQADGLSQLQKELALNPYGTLISKIVIVILANTYRQSCGTCD